MLIFIAELFGIFHSRLPKPLIIIVIGKRCDNFMGLVKKMELLIVLIRND
jgi:hypothetical protein